MQLAARQGEALSLLLYHQAVDLNLPLSLALDLSATEHGITVDIKKRQGGWRPAPFQLSMQQRWPKLVRQQTADNVYDFAVTTANGCKAS